MNKSWSLHNSQRATYDLLEQCYSSCKIPRSLWDRRWSLGVAKAEDALIEVHY